ncbi:MAG: DUF4832 domain-containing protein [Dysgonomonas sp.]|nr:DUF4832 domain-containing protein [Dysgonomonas sp.]
MKNKLRFTALGYMISLLITFGACSSNDNDEDDNSSNPSDNISVSITPERTKLLRNPMTGWVIYSGLGDGLSDNFWKDYDEFTSAKGIVKVSDYATTLFIRGAWSDFNPEENKYVWDADVNTKPAQRFKMLAEGAKERNLKLAFSFIVDSQDKHYNFTPNYVKNAAGITGYITTTGSVQVWSPYPDNPVFKQYYEKFIKAVAEKYDDADLVQFISGTGLGKWGESHTVRYSTENDEPREAIFDWVTDLYANSFKNVPIVINYHRCILSRSAWFDSNDQMLETAQKLLDKAVNKGFSLRHDALGMKSYYKTWEKNYANGKKFKRPILAEGGWVKNSHGNSIKNDGYANYAEVRKGEFEDAKAAYANMMDFRYSKNIVNGETFSWLNDAYNLVEEFIAEGGYRLYPDRVSLPPKVKNGSTISINHRWSNLGWGYCPTNIPQWKDKYKVAFALLDKNDLTPKYVFVDSEPELADCTKGSSKSYTFSQKISGVTTGNYIWAIGIIDTTKDNKIGIQISAKENITSDGWLKLCDVTIQ